MGTLIIETHAYEGFHKFSTGRYRVYTLGWATIMRLGYRISDAWTGISGKDANQERLPL